MPRKPPDIADEEELDWAFVQEQLVKAINDLQRDHFLILEPEWPQDTYVQIAHWKKGKNRELLVEVSLGPLDSDRSRSALLDMGWHPPGSYHPGDSPNFACLWVSEWIKKGGFPPEDVEDAAAMAGSALRFILGVPRIGMIHVIPGSFK